LVEEFTVIITGTPFFNLRDVGSPPENEISTNSYLMKYSIVMDKYIYLFVYKVILGQGRHHLGAYQMLDWLLYPVQCKTFSTVLSLFLIVFCFQQLCMQPKNYMLK
jgi:hypothetical protein